jgi:hypothetical protein
MKKLLSLTAGLLLLTCDPSLAGNTDKYQIYWQGKKGVVVHGTYTISYPQSPDTPTRIESIEVPLPTRITLVLPKNVRVSAHGYTIRNDFKLGKVVIRIFRNGKECGKPTTVGSGTIENKVCK